MPHNWIVVYETDMVFTAVGIYLLTVGAVAAYTPFRVSDCGSDTNRLAQPFNFHLYEYPIRIPGDIWASGNLAIFRQVGGHVRLDVTVEKHFLFQYFTLPCISRVGSCSYDLCTLLDKLPRRGLCPWQLRASNIPCTCPFDMGNHTLTPQPFHVPSLRQPWMWLVEGDFRVTGRLTDTRTGQEVGCSRVQFTVQRRQQQASNWWDLLS